MPRMNQRRLNLISLKIPKMMLDYIEDPDRVYWRTADQCKICSKHAPNGKSYRGLIEDLRYKYGIPQPALAALITKYLMIGEEISQQCVSNHFERHTRKVRKDAYLEVPAPVEIEEAFLATKDSGAPAALVALFNSAVAPYMAGKRRPTLEQGLKAIKLYIDFPQAMLDAEFKKLTLKRMKEEDAKKVINGSIIKEEAV